MLDALFGRGKESIGYSLPKPSWTESELPQEEVERVASSPYNKDKYEPAFYGIEFKGRKLNPAAVRHYAKILGEAYAKLQPDRSIAFVSYGDDQRQVILPLRRNGLDTEIARGKLDSTIRNSTTYLQEEGLPVIDIQMIVNPFLRSHRQYTRS